MNQNYKNVLKSVFLFIIVSIFAFVPCYNMLIKGVFNWHIHQKEFYEGAIELVVYGILMTFVYIVLRKNVLFPLIFFSIIYLCVSGVIIPVCIDLIYFEAIIFVGHSFFKFIAKNQKSDYIKDFLAGVSVWGTVAIIMSLIKHGTITELRIMTFVLLAISFLLNGKKIYKPVSIEIAVKIKNNVNGLFSFGSTAVLALIFLALFAKTQSAHDYDSLWYGLRPEQVLFGSTSFYNNLWYISFVNYYPKLMELFFAPISNLGDYSFIQSANIYFLIMLAYLIKCFIDEFCKNIDYALSVLIICVIVTIPALANIAATPKPDISGCFLVFLAFYYLSKSLKDNDFSNVVFGAVSLLFCTGTKLTYLLWGGLLFSWFILSYYLKKEKNSLKKEIPIVKKYVPFLILSLFFIGGIHLRTLKLTGYPLYPVFLSLFEKIGFHANQFFLTSSSKGSGISKNLNFSFSYAAEVILKIVFDPRELPHVIMLWTSNVPIITLLMFFFIRKKDRLTFSDFTLSFSYGIFCIFYLSTLSVPDGNYFILPLIVSSLILLKYLEFIHYRKLMIITCCIILFTQLPIMFVSHPSWKWGTHAFSNKIFENNFDSEKRNQQILEYHGLGKININLSSLKPWQRVICDGDENIIFRLHFPVEPLNLLNYQYEANGILDSFENFFHYLEVSQPYALIVTDSAPDFYREYVKKLDNMNLFSVTINDEKAVCYIFNWIM